LRLAAKRSSAVTPHSFWALGQEAKRIPVSDDGLLRMMELACGQFNLRIEPKETIGLVGPTSRHRAKRVFFLRSGFSAGVLGILFLDPPAEWSLLLPDDGAGELACVRGQQPRTGAARAEQVMQGADLVTSPVPPAAAWLAAVRGV
jgi:hypothetical protein